MSFDLTVLDGINVRAHQKAAGAARKGAPRERDQREALGRPRGSYGTKVCVTADGQGQAVTFRLAPG